MAFRLSSLPIFMAFWSISNWRMMATRRTDDSAAPTLDCSSVAKATAVVVNPTHYAVAIRYEQGAMAAPMVVAKGKNYLAARIRLRAVENLVPIIENPPLAQALYKSVDVGQEIPAHLYRAVAEILAYIFKLMGHKGKR
jgi:flagellar biosynthetic protein FlhB